MPTYEYECTKCGHSFERFQSMKDEPLKRCPKCRCKVRRLVGSGAGIIFKGSGFYQTDYRSSNYNDAAKKEKTAGESAGSSVSDSKATEKKAETGKEKKPAKASIKAD